MCMFVFIGILIYFTYIKIDVHKYSLLRRKNAYFFQINFDIMYLFKIIEIILAQYFYVNIYIYIFMRVNIFFV